MFIPPRGWEAFGRPRKYRVVFAVAFSAVAIRDVWEPPGDRRNGGQLRRRMAAAPVYVGYLRESAIVYQRARHRVLRCDGRI